MDLQAENLPKGFPRQLQFPQPRHLSLASLIGVCVEGTLGADDGPEGITPGGVDKCGGGILVTFHRMAYEAWTASPRGAYEQGLCFDLLFRETANPPLRNSTLHVYPDAVALSLAVIAPVEMRPETQKERII